MQIANNGKIIQHKVGRGTSAVKKHHQYIHKMVTDESIKSLYTDNCTLLRLQEVKNHLKGLENNPFNMNMASGHANAKVRHWFLRLVTKGLPVESNGHIEIQKLYAFEFGDAVVYANLQAMRNTISTEKNANKQKAMKKRYDIIASLPKKESYYK